MLDVILYIVLFVVFVYFGAWLFDRVYRFFAVRWHLRVPKRKKSWLDNGFRSWKLETESFHWFKIIWQNETYQGDVCKSLTIHLFGRAYQWTRWSP